MTTLENNKKIVIVIPAFNEATVIEQVLGGLKKESFENVVVIDDGSLDDTYSIAKKSGFVVLRHLINRGKGAATQTGLDAAGILGADVVVSMDADDQHSVEDVKTLIAPIMNNECDVVLGSRFLVKNSGIPGSKIMMNKIANLITYIFYGVFVTDSQSGFRAYSKKANELIHTDMDRYEFESQILNQIRYFGLSYKEVPISVKYNKYTKTKYDNMKGVQPQNLLNGIKMVFKMIIRSIMS